MAAKNTHDEGKEGATHVLTATLPVLGTRLQVFTIRRIIGESVLDRNEGLWREVDALEDILKEAQVGVN